MKFIVLDFTFTIKSSNIECNMYKMHGTIVVLYY